MHGMANVNQTPDVLVIGGGNAALCAAMTAREAGATVLVLEHAPKDFRGGNSRHTRNLRVMHLNPTATLTNAYSEEEYWKDLLGVTAGKTDESLARMTIRGHVGCPFLDGSARRAFSAVAERHAEPVAHQCFFSGRRQSADERVLLDRGAPGHRGSV